MSKIKVSELFYSLQGEGRFVGVPSIFLRTFGCNLTCAGFGCAPGEKSTEADEIAKQVHLYKEINDLPLAKTGCDSYMSWHPAFKHLSPNYTTEELAEKMVALTPNNYWVQNNYNDVHLVITGGEPLLGWQRAYAELLEQPKMFDLRNITFETNGTQELRKDFVEYLGEWCKRDPKREVTFSVSAKMSSSGEDLNDTIKPEIVASYEKVGFTYLKFVVETEEHFNEIVGHVDKYRAAGFAGPVYIMPVGGTVASYDKNRTPIADLALQRGYYYSPRLHVDLWANGWAR